MIKQPILVLFLAFITFACTQNVSENSNLEEKLSQTSLVLTDNTWNLLELNGAPIEIDENFNGIPHITFEIEENKVFGNAGCNSFFGAYETGENNDITLSQMGSTMMACPNLKIEDEFLSALENIKSYQIDSNILTLKAEDNQVIGKFENMVQISEGDLLNSSEEE